MVRNACALTAGTGLAAVAVGRAQQAAHGSSSQTGNLQLSIGRTQGLQGRQAAAAAVTAESQVAVAAAVDGFRVAAAKDPEAGGRRPPGMGLQSAGRRLATGRSSSLELSKLRTQTASSQRNP